MRTRTQIANFIDPARVKTGSTETQHRTGTRASIANFIDYQGVSTQRAVSKVKDAQSEAFATALLDFRQSNVQPKIIEIRQKMKACEIAFVDKHANRPGFSVQDYNPYIKLRGQLHQLQEKQEKYTRLAACLKGDITKVHSAGSTGNNETATPTARAIAADPQYIDMNDFIVLATKGPFVAPAVTAISKPRGHGWRKLSAAECQDLYGLISSEKQGLWKEVRDYCSILFSKYPRMHPRIIEKAGSIAGPRINRPDQLAAAGAGLLMQGRDNKLALCANKYVKKNHPDLLTNELLEKARPLGIEGKTALLFEIASPALAMVFKNRARNYINFFDDKDILYVIGARENDTVWKRDIDGVTAWNINGKTVLLQHVSGGSTAAAPAMLIADKAGVDRINFDSLEQANSRKNSDIYDFITDAGFTPIKTKLQSGRMARIRNQGTMIAQVQNALNRYGPAIVHVNGHSVVVDEVRKDSVVIRTSVHGLMIALKRSAFEKSIKDNSVIIQIAQKH